MEDFRNIKRGLRVKYLKAHAPLVPRIKNIITSTSKYNLAVFDAMAPLFRTLPGFGDFDSNSTMAASSTPAADIWASRPSSAENTSSPA